jgi:hypothetical protein
MEYLMEISILLKDNKITTGKGLPIEAICKGQKFLPTGKKFLYWAPAQPEDDIEGHEILVTGTSYIIAHRQYDLESGYAIKATLTPKNVVIPKLRVARGKEIGVIKDQNNQPINGYWPIIVKRPKALIEPKNLEQPSKKGKNQELHIMEEAMLNLSEINENFSLPEEEEWFEDNPDF